MGAGGDLTLLPAFGTLFFLLSCLTQAWCKNMGLVLLSLDVLGSRPWKACSFQGRVGGWIQGKRGSSGRRDWGGWLGRGNCNPDEIYMKEELTERKEIHVRLPHLCSKPPWASCSSSPVLFHPQLCGHGGLWVCCLYLQCFPHIFTQSPSLSHLSVHMRPAQ